MTQYAELYLQEIVRLHGIPARIVSDRDPRFTSHFWESLHKGLGTKLSFNTTFHPQTDGQSERVIQTLEDLLRACLIDYGGNWEPRLPLIEFAYNNSFQSSIGMAPLKHYMGRSAGHHYIGTRFGKKGKLSLGPRYIGPFEILEEIGDVAYRLVLPPTFDTVHNVFHVSNLRKYIPNPTHIIHHDVMQWTPNLTYEEVSTEIIVRQIRRLRNKEINMVKVLWSNHSVDEATWEVEEDMQQKYPDLFGRRLARLSSGSLKPKYVLGFYWDWTSGTSSRRSYPYRQVSIQEPFVNITKDIIREALNFVIGND
ncbi:uncharacterized protein LOC124913713 [Impatiens glandulifera]|uniref:uncharacterized protein LOC124913713 n=1 Tax=Impatiens glandulifera TaxID=253017 RepID=UPI001FB169DC|nr:uncharacterized protein LOC124913713 [Impatiens glandulifera]